MVLSFFTSVTGLTFDCFLRRGGLKGLKFIPGIAISSSLAHSLRVQRRD